MAANPQHWFSEWGKGLWLEQWPCPLLPLLHGNNRSETQNRAASKFCKLPNMEILWEGKKFLLEGALDLISFLCTGFATEAQSHGGFQVFL